MTNYLEELNESQRNAVLYNEGPSLVIAGAGSGKTRVLTYKIAYLLERGYTPWSILALTFTNKAAREMKERIARQVGDQARYLWMGTFHSIFSRILRCEAQAVGFTSNFTIYDSSDSKSLIKSIVKEMQLDDKTYKPGVIQARISNAKNHLVFPDAYVSNAELYQYDLNAKVPATRDIYRRYWERCRQSDAMDFDDFFSDATTKTANVLKTDIHEKDGYYVLSMEAPGVKKEDIQIELKDGYLKVTASRNSSKEDKDEKGRIIRQERYSGSSSRSFYVGEGIKQEDVKANFDNGELIISIPTETKKVEEETKFIPIL